MINIQAVKTKSGYYIKPSDKTIIVDCEMFPSFNNNWFFVNRKPKFVKIKETITHKWFELKNPKLESEKIPLRLEYDYVEPYYDEDVDGYKWSRHNDISSLYVTKYHSEENLVDVDFTFDIVFEIKGDLSEPELINYEYKSGNFTNNNVEHQQIDKIVFPEIILHELPARISSIDLYNIIRSYIKSNIDPKNAEITSDYDFCFTVQKRVHTNPYKKTISYYKSINSKKPSTKEIVISHKLVQVFEMTSQERAYKGYTQIQPVVAKNERELKKKIDEILSYLIEKINEPIKECERCKGKGCTAEKIKIEG